MGHSTPTAPTFLQLLFETKALNVFDPFKLIYSNWQNAILCTFSPKNTIGLIFITVQNKKEPKGFKWLFVYLEYQGVRDQAREVVFYFRFIPLLWYRGTCPLASGRVISVGRLPVLHCFTTKYLWSLAWGLRLDWKPKTVFGEKTKLKSMYYQLSPQCLSGSNTCQFTFKSLGSFSSPHLLNGVTMDYLEAVASYEVSSLFPIKSPRHQ
jgi:hypothetical protein